MDALRRSLTLAATTSLVAASVVTAPIPLASAQVPGVTVELSSVDGSAPFDASTLPGHDDGRPTTSSGPTTTSRTPSR